MIKQRLLRCEVLFDYIHESSVITEVLVNGAQESQKAEDESRGQREKEGEKFDGVLLALKMKEEAHKSKNVGSL